MHNNAPFRFLDLLPELRNIIYGYVLEDEAEPELPLLQASKHAPSAAITAVCRSLRAETLLWHQEALKRFYPEHTFTLQTSVPTASDPVARRKLDSTLRALSKAQAQAPGLRRLKLIEQYDELRVSLLFEITAPGEVAVSHEISSEEGPDVGSWVQQSLQRIADGSAKGVLAAAKEARTPFYSARDPETLDVRSIYCAWLRPFGVVLEPSHKAVA